MCVCVCVLSREHSARTDDILRLDLHRNAKRVVKVEKRLDERLHRGLVLPLWAQIRATTAAKAALDVDVEGGSVGLEVQACGDATEHVAWLCPVVVWVYLQRDQDWFLLRSKAVASRLREHLIRWAVDAQPSVVERNQLVIHVHTGNHPQAGTLVSRVVLLKRLEKGKYHNVEKRLRSVFARDLSPKRL